MIIKKKHIGFPSGFVRFTFGLEINWHFFSWSLPLGIDRNSKHLLFIEVLFVSFIFET